MFRQVHRGFGRRQSLIFVILSFAVAGLCPGVATAEVMGAKKSKVYHTQPDRCGPAKNIASGNKVTFKDIKEAEGEGRRKCKTCARIEENMKEEEPKKKEPPPSRGGGRGQPKKEEPAGGTEPVEQERSRPVEKVEQPPAVVETVRVKRVLPGATLELETGERVRLAGVGVPIADQPMADEVFARVEKLVKGRKVTLAWMASGESGRDRFGRRAAFAVVGSDKEDIGGLLISDGLAWVDRSTTFELLSEYLRREDDAAWSQRGIWLRTKGAKGAASVVVGKFTREYHSPDCPHAVLLIEPASISVNEAKGRRLTPCEFWRAP